MANSLSKTGQVREFLANMMIGVKDGSIKVDEARTMVKLAEKINESFYSEIKVTELDIKLGNKPGKFGELAINTR